MQVIVQIPYGNFFVLQEYLSCPCKKEVLKVSISGFFTFLRVEEVLHTDQGPILYTIPLRETVQSRVLEAFKKASLLPNQIRAPQRLIFPRDES